MARGCPHCGAAEQTVEHQLWCCPRWDAVRQRAAAKEGLDWRGVAANASQLTLHALLRTPCPHRAALATLAPAPPGVLAAPRWLGEQPAHPTVWAGGAGSKASSCGLARAAWAFCSTDSGLAAAGPVPGHQTAQRAELFAAFQALAAHGGRACLVTDSQYVARGIARLPGWPRPPDWKHSDIWEALHPAARSGDLIARWVPAHRDGPGPPLLSHADWLGNAEADRLAGAALLAAQPGAALVAAAEYAKNSTPWQSR